MLCVHPKSGLLEVTYAQRSASYGVKREALGALTFRGIAVVRRRVLDMSEKDSTAKHTELVQRVCVYVAWSYCTTSSHLLTCDGHREVFGGNRIARILSLPLHQQLVLCAMYCMRLHDKEIVAREVCCLSPVHGSSHGCILITVEPHSSAGHTRRCARA